MGKSRYGLLLYLNDLPRIYLIILKLKAARPSKVKVEDVSTNFLSVEIFDRFTEKGIVRENGNIKQCLDEFHDDIIISDELRKVNDLFFCLYFKKFNLIKLFLRF